MLFSLGQNVSLADGLPWAMVVEAERIISFSEWLPKATLDAAISVAVLALLVLVASWLTAVMRRGPAAGTQAFGTGVGEAATDLFCMSPRRLGALSLLTFKEAIRRRIVIVFGIFVLWLLFGSWFLDPGSDEPARLYLSVVLDWGAFLVLLLMLVLSVLSLPADIANRTIHTVATKPVRRSEIVVGRMLGFTLVGTLLLTAMAAISLVFVWRGLKHEHELRPADLENTLRQWAGAPGAPPAATLRTSVANNHWHKIALEPGSLAADDDDGVRRGAALTTVEQGHWHEAQYAIRPQGDGKPEVACAFGSPEGMLVARSPIRGKLSFKDRSGKDAEKGINVGDEWTYRSYVEGGTLAAAIWTFDRLSADEFPDGLPVEMTIGVFRTHKGNIEKGVLGGLSVRNPKTGLIVPVRNFQAREFEIDTQRIPRKLRTAEGREVDLFRDLVDEGRLEVWLRCLDAQQYFGAAQADMYLRAPDRSFVANFLKGYLGIWLRMTLIIGFGVMFSTFLSGPIALLATLGIMIGGWQSDFVGRLARGETFGGGPTESLWRLFTQQNVVSELPEGLHANVVRAIDTGARKVLQLIWHSLPDFAQLNFSDEVASGFDISGDLVLMSLCRAAMFLVPLIALAYLFLKTRELAQ